MYFIGVDLHKRFLVAAVQDERGDAVDSKTIPCTDVEGIDAYFEQWKPFRAVIEASSSFRWLYDQLCPLGDVVIAHPLRLRALCNRRAKTDQLDAERLAELLRGGFIPESYAPPLRYAHLREFTRGRAQVVRRRTQAVNELHGLMTRKNLHGPYKKMSGPRGRQWLRSQLLPFPLSTTRDELLARIEHYDARLKTFDQTIEVLVGQFREVEALLDIPGVGPFSALLIVGEIAEPERFPDGRKVGSYAGLTARVSQSGSRCHYGRITRQGSPWLRWVLVQIAMKASKRDFRLRNMHERIRKRSSASIARVAVARKLASICWVRLRRWHRAQPTPPGGGTN